MKEFLTEMVKKAFITCITGQDGSYLAEFLLSKSYEVHGLVRRASTFNTYRIDHFYVDPPEPSAQLVEAARLEKLDKFVQIGTVCTFPKFTPAPFKEDNYRSGYPEENKRALRNCQESSFGNGTSVQNTI
jgi:hypothetical protein